MTALVVSAAAVLLLLAHGFTVTVELAGVAFWCRCAWLDVIQG